MAIVGYARVSTRDQDLAGQLAELKAAGCELVYREKVSGAASDRKELARLVRKLERGDTVIVTRLDRLARSTRDLLNILDEIGKAGAGFRSIKDTWADTTTSHGRLMLTILGGLCGVRTLNSSRVPRRTLLAHRAKLSGVDAFPFRAHIRSGRSMPVRGCLAQHPQGPPLALTGDYQRLSSALPSAGIARLA